MKKKITIVLISLILAFFVASFVVGCVTPAPTGYQVTINTPAGVTDVQVMDGDTAVTSGTRVEEGTELTISWGINADILQSATLVINGDPVTGASPQTHTVTGATVITFNVVPVDPDGEYAVTFTAPNGVTDLEVTLDGDAIASGDLVEAGEEIEISWDIDTAVLQSATLVINGDPVVGASPQTHTVTGATEITFNVVEVPQTGHEVTIALTPNVTNVVVMAGDVVITSGTRVDEGTELTVSWQLGAAAEVALRVNNINDPSAQSGSTITVTGDTTIAFHTVAAGFTVNDQAGLANMEFVPDGTFVLNANLTLTNWVPIGTPAAPFTGRLVAPVDAYGVPLYTIESLSVTPTTIGNTTYIGLFGVSEGTIQNIDIEEFNVNFAPPASAITANYRYTIVGGIASINRGIIENSVVEGDITVDIPSVTHGTPPEEVRIGNGARIGLIAGVSEGRSATISRSSAFGTITFYGEDGGQASRAGALVGILSDNARLYQTAADVDVFVTTTEANVSAAGLVGHMELGGAIRESAAFGDVLATSATGTIYAGGLVGNVDGENSVADGYTAATYPRNNFIIEDVFATGNATGMSGGNSYVSALIARLALNGGATGVGNDVTISNAFGTGDSVMQEGGNEHVGGLIGRIQTGNAVSETVITIENSFVTGDVTNLGGGDAGFITSRVQNAGEVIIEGEVWHNYNAELNGQARTDAIESAAVAFDTLISLAWQTENLTSWDAGVWTFVNGYLPVLSWLLG